MLSQERDNERLRSERVNEFETRLLGLYGAVVGGRELWRLLGYPSGDAFRQAVHRKQLPVPTFIPEGRRTRMARVHDIAVWLASLDDQLDGAAELPG